MSDSEHVELEIKYMDIVEEPIDIGINSAPNHRLIDVIKSFLELIPFTAFWLEFYDSHREWLRDTNQKVAEYLKSNRPVIHYQKKVPLKFRVLRDPNFTDWCLYHGRNIDNVAIPEIGDACGFNSEMLLSTVCERFGDKFGYSKHQLTFYNSDGQNIFNSLPPNVNLGQFFKLNGPMIFYTYQPEADIDNFYLDDSPDPHSTPKRFKHFDGMTVDDLSRNYKHKHSSLMEIDNGEIEAFIGASETVQGVLDDQVECRLGDLYDRHSESEKHFDVSVQFINGGDTFVNPVLVCAIDGETIKSFSQRLLAKIVEPDQIAECLKSLRIEMGSGHFKCNSSVKLTKPPASNVIAFCVVDAANLRTELKYCDYGYDFCFYDKTKPWHRVKFCYTKVTHYNPAKLSSVIKSFIEFKQLTPDGCDFFDSLGNPIESQHKRSTVADYARKNDLVIFYAKKSSG